jgi:uncharacterized damage-inducible protein DinB
MDDRRKTALTMLEYHAWATAKAIESVEPLSHEELTRDMQTSHSSVFGTLAHIYGADWIWLKRLSEGVSPTFRDVPVVSELTDLRTAWRDVQARLISFAGGLDDADWSRMVEYRLMSGDAAVPTPIYETLLHIVNHGTYHRGQIVTMLRQMGAEPIPTDFIRYLWAIASA